MLKSIIRKAVQVMDDPVLRRWMIGRAMRKFPGEPSYKAHRPPYLDDLLPLSAETPQPPQAFGELATAAPTNAIELSLPGLNLTLRPGDESDLFDRSFPDTEILHAVHRFAWLPLLGDQIDPAWVGAIWRAWHKHYQSPDDSWAWHPYTTAERAINILRFARSHGLPGTADETLDCLTRHAPVIAERLEYFGEHHTSNHLANDGRGLFLLGLWLGLPKATKMGGRILTREAARIFHPSGLLREGSSHYHLLLAKSYAEAASAAAAFGREEAPALRTITEATEAATAMFILPGGLPLIGDISPDCPPQKFLEDLAITAPKTTTSASDGWLRNSDGPWSGLWHLSPQGWRQMPGHGHEDGGGFELHFEDAPLFIDPGRGSYGKDGEFACSGQAHNTLLVDGADPYPPNRPYYDDDFRHQVCGDDPVLEHNDDCVWLTHNGYRRFHGLGAVSRCWRFDPQSLTISDTVDGHGTHTVSRLLVTSLGAETDGDAVLLRGDKYTFRITAPGVRPSLVPITRWKAYGLGEEATQICFQNRGPLPWSGDITVEKI